MTTLKTCLLSLFLFSLATCRPVPFILSAIQQHDFMNQLQFLALRDPSGSYKGTKSVLGQSITIEADFDQLGEMNLDFSGPLTINCTDEPYSYGGGTITLTNLDKSGDCVHDALQQNSVQLESMTYDSASDTIQMKAKYTFLQLTIELEHQTKANPIVRSQFTRDLTAAFGQQPAALDVNHNPESELDKKNKAKLCGRYEGSRNVHGHQVNVTMNIKTKSTMNINVTGVVPVDCKKEKYCYHKLMHSISFPKLKKKDDCLHDALKNSSQKVSIKHIHFDTCKNRIILCVMYSTVPITFELKHDDNDTLQELGVDLNEDTEIPEEENQLALPNSEAFESTGLTSGAISALFELYSLYAQHEPMGTYYGSKQIVGRTIEWTSVISSSTNPSLISVMVTGLLNVDCPAEQYIFAAQLDSDENILLPNLSNSSDCLRTSLEKSGVVIKGMKYDPVSDEINVALQMIVNINLVLKHKD